MKRSDKPPLGNCHKVRMVLSFLRLDYEKVSIALPYQEQKSSGHLARHPPGKVPALKYGDVTV